MISFPLDIGDIQTRVLRSGRGQRHVLFLHGAGARADRWADTAQALDPDLYSAYAIDFPGHGFATKGDIPAYSVTGYAAFVRAVMGALDLARPAVVGTSMGAHVASWLACEEPEEVNGLCLVGAVGLTPLDKTLSEMIAGSLLALDREHIAMKLRVVLKNHALVTDEFIEEEWRINNSAGAHEGFAMLVAYWREALPNDVIGDRLAAMKHTLPIRLIWGSEDRSSPPAMGHAAAALLTDGRLHMVPGAGHAPYLDAPEAFNAVLHPFLEALSWS